MNWFETRRRRRLSKALASLARLSLLTPEEIKTLLRAHLLADGYTEVVDYGTTTNVEYRKLPPLVENKENW